jgi:PIN domain nuclease of toxin-antitoxin system
MRLLLDTHALLWWLIDEPSLPATARRLIGKGSNQIVVSAASAWEIGAKVRLGKLPSGAESLARDFAAHLARERFEELPISAEHAIRASLLPGPHKDPFDRTLAAQSQAENLPIISNDAVFDAFGVRRLW